MATANALIRAALIRHRVALLRYGSGLRTRMLSLVDETETELRQLLLRRLEMRTARGFDTGPVTTARLAALNEYLARLEEIIGKQQAATFEAVRELVRSELVGLAQSEVAFAARAITENVGLVLSLATPSAGDLRSIVLSRPFQGRILRDWLADFEVNDRARMMAAVQSGMLAGETPTQIARRIFGTRALHGTDGVREITRRGAQTLAQTATAAVSNNARAAFYQANKRLIPKELFVATLDSRTTPICQSLDGERFDVGEGPQPPLHMNCRSLRVPVMDADAMGDRPANRATEEALEGLRGPERRAAVARLVGQVPAGTTYQQFLADSPAAFQDSVLGPTRGQLFRKGGLSVDRFVDDSGKQYTLAQLRDIEPEAFRRAGL